MVKLSEGHMSFVIDTAAISTPALRMSAMEMLKCVRSKVSTAISTLALRMSGAEMLEMFENGNKTVFCSFENVDHLSKAVATQLPSCHLPLQPSWYLLLLMYLRIPESMSTTWKDMCVTIFTQHGLYSSIGISPQCTANSKGGNANI